MQSGLTRKEVTKPASVEEQQIIDNKSQEKETTVPETEPDRRRSSIFKGKSSERVETAPTTLINN